MLRKIKLFVLMMSIAGVTMLASESLSNKVKFLDLESRDIRCGSCALTIKRAVNKVDGVKRVDVSTSTKGIHVEYDEDRVTENQIMEKIIDAGFSVEKTK